MRRLRSLSLLALSLAACESGTAARARLDAHAARMQRGYLDRTLADRAADARRYLAAADSFPDAERPADRARADSLARLAAAADSLRFVLRVESDGLGRWLVGRVANPTGRDFDEVVLRIVGAAGDTTTAELFRVDAEFGEEVHDLTGLAPGPVRRVDVLDAR
jgi:hypothetical protein